MVWLSSPEWLQGIGDDNHARGMGGDQSCLEPGPVPMTGTI